jgi:hypothetical protein
MRLAHPILINRPIVVTPWGVKLWRPSEAVLNILPLPQRGPFAKEDGERVALEPPIRSRCRPGRAIETDLAKTSADALMMACRFDSVLVVMAQ